METFIMLIDDPTENAVDALEVDSLCMQIEADRESMRGIKARISANIAALKRMIGAGGVGVGVEYEALEKTSITYKVNEAKAAELMRGPYSEQAIKVFGETGGSFSSEEYIATKGKRCHAPISECVTIKEGATKITIKRTTVAKPINQ